MENSWILLGGSDEAEVNRSSSSPSPSPLEEFHLEMHRVREALELAERSFASQSIDSGGEVSSNSSVRSSPLNRDPPLVQQQRITSARFSPPPHPPPPPHDEKNIESEDDDDDDEDSPGPFSATNLVFVFKSAATVMAVLYIGSKMSSAMSTSHNHHHHSHSSASMCSTSSSSAE